MDMRKLGLLILFSLASLATTAQVNGPLDFGIARHFRISSASNGLDPGPNGGSFSISYSFPFKQKFVVKPGIEIGANGISNYALISAGIYHHLNLKSDRFELEYGIKMLNGSALFQQQGLYIFGVSEETTFSMLTKKGNTLGLFLELRYINAPTYSKYSNVSSFIDLNFGLKVGFSLGKI